MASTGVLSGRVEAAGQGPAGAFARTNGGREQIIDRLARAARELGRMVRDAGGSEQSAGARPRAPRKQHPSAAGPTKPRVTKGPADSARPRVRPAPGAKGAAGSGGTRTTVPRPAKTPAAKTRSTTAESGPDAAEEPIRGTLPPEKAASETPPGGPAPDVRSDTMRGAALMEVALAWLGRKTQYVSGATRADWNRGRFDCSGFLLQVLHECGIDISEPIAPEHDETYDVNRVSSDGPTLYDQVHMTEEVLPELGAAREAAGDAEVEAILRRHGIPRRGSIDARVARLPEGRDKTRARSLRRRAEAARARRLRELVEADDARIMGVVHALGTSGIGRRVDLGEVRPGDMVQTWTFTSQGVRGHAALVHAVRCRADVLGALGTVFHDVEIVLDATTDPSSLASVAEVLSVELLGAHSQGVDHTGRRHPGGVYVKPPTRLVPGEDSGFDRIYVGRLTGSSWD